MSANIFHKAIFVGDSSVGKTSIINYIVFGTCGDNQKTTVGIDYFTFNKTFGDKTLNMQLWDTAGQEKFHSLIPSYIRDSTVALLVFDITSKKSFENLQMWHQTILNTTKIPIFVVGNKVDLDFDRQVESEEGEKFAKEIDSLYFEASARDGTCINEILEKISELPVPQKDDIHIQKEGNNNETIVIKLNEERQNNNDSGCFC